MTETNFCDIKQRNIGLERPQQRSETPSLLELLKIVRQNLM